MGLQDEARTDWLIASATVLAILGVVALLVTWSWPFNAVALFSNDNAVDCDEYSFDHAAWNRGDTADDEAAALAKCGTLTGMSKREVGRMLGYAPRAPQGNVWHVGAGEVNDYMGPGDGQTLNVRFDDDGVVTEADLRSPPN